MTPITVFNRLLAMILALILLLGGLLAVVEIVLAQADQPHWLVPHERWTNWLADQSWDGGVIRVVLIGIGVVGLLLLLPALRRGKPRTLKVSTAVAGVTVAVSRRGVERTVAAAARRTDGISGASASAGRRSVKVSARTPLRTPGDLRDTTLASVGARLDELGLTEALTPKLRLTRKDAR